VRARFLLGPAGSGKTFRCLLEIRRALAASQEGAPLLLVTPKQTTYQLERQFLADSSIPGYTRLHILSFERLAHFVFERLGAGSPEMLNEEGRLMVLRALLARKRDGLKLFRASARLTGFAQQLSLVLSELQRNQLTPESLNQLAAQVQDIEGLGYKLQDLATLLGDYLDWLKTHNLKDADCLLQAAAETLTQHPEKTQEPEPNSPLETTAASRIHSPLSTLPSPLRTPHSPLCIQSLWVDGFAEFSEQELNLLAAMVPCCEEATLTFCLDRVPLKETSWLSNWSVVRKSFEACRKRLSSLTDASVSVEVLQRDPAKSRFLDSPVLQHLERHWADPEPYQIAALSSESRSSATAPVVSDDKTGAPRSALDESLHIAICADPDAEVTLAAHEVLNYVRSGGRYRDVTVLVRKLEGYHEPLQRLFSRYGIPFFLDRREPVSHHPLAELTRSALRTVATQWMRDDWFAALKTGLVSAQEREIDELENEALARGWRGSVWHQPLRLREQPRSPADLERLRALEGRLETLRQRLMPPFQQLALALTRQSKPSGPQLAGAVREFWKSLNVEERLQQWAATEMAGAEARIPNSVHATVWEQMNAWAANVELAFATETLPLREWLPILDAGLSGLSVGVIPPALDQVLIGAIDRSRNPDIKLALVLGLNETVFPALPEATVLLTEMDRAELERRNILRSGTTRQQLGRERYHAYIACTRARQRVVLTSAQHDANGATLNPSPFLAQVQQLFPSLEPEKVPKTLDWRESRHASELIGPLLALQGRSRESGETMSESRITHHESPPSGLALLASLPAIASVLERLRNFHSPELEERLSPELAGRLYGPVLRTALVSWCIAEFLTR